MTQTLNDKTHNGTKQDKNRRHSTSFSSHYLKRKKEIYLFAYPLNAHTTMQREEGVLYYLFEWRVAIPTDEMAITRKYAQQNTTKHYHYPHRHLFLFLKCQTAAAAHTFLQPPRRLLLSLSQQPNAAS